MSNGSLGSPVPGGTLQSPASLIGLAALGVAQPPHAQFPGGGANLQATGQAEVAIGEGGVDQDDAVQGTVGVLVGADRG